MSLRVWHSPDQMLLFIPNELFKTDTNAVTPAVTPKPPNNAPATPFNAPV